MDNVKCMNPWDPQSKRQYQIDGVYAALNAGHAQGGQAHGICYSIEGNVVDRVSSKNGKGWCEDVSPTLNTQDRHAICFAWNNSSDAEISASEKISPTVKATRSGEPAICFQLCGDRDDPSVSVSATAYCIPANPMSDRGQAVCYKE